MSRRGRQVLLTMIGAGLAARLVLAFASVGSDYDMTSFAVVAAELSSPADVYSRVNQEIPFGGEMVTLFRWPYSPAFFPWIYVSEFTADHTALPLHGLIQLPGIAADVAIALLIVYALGRRGATERTRLTAAGLVLLGPSFLVTSGYHGQFDSLAILPAIVAVLAWQGSWGGRRATVAGLLLGAGAALKTVPALMVLALLPTATSWREGARLVAFTAAVPIILLVPFAIVDPAGVRDLASYAGAPGMGGISLVIQPDLANRWLTERPFELSGASELLLDHGSLFMGAVLLVAAAILIRLRTPPVAAAILIWLIVWVFGPGFFFQYLVWGLPFVILAGRLVEAAVLQAVLLGPMLAFYLGPWQTTDLAYAYVPVMIAVWAAMVVAIVLLIRGITSEGPRPASTPPA
jgi:hypothetical protein